MSSNLNNEQSSDASDGEESMSNVLSVQSDSRNESKSNADDSEDEQDMKKRMEELLKKHSKKGKGKPATPMPKKLVPKSDKKPVAKPAKAPKTAIKLEKAPPPKPKELPKAKAKPAAKDDKLPIDKSKLKYSQINLLKQKSKSTLYDKRAEESISNILNRKAPSPRPLTRTASFTQKSYLDKSAALIEADQTLQIKDQKPVTSARISPEKMTTSLRTIVKHLFQNKKSLDTSQMNKQEAKSTVKFTLNSFIDEDGTRGD